MMKSYGLFGFLGFISLSFVFALPARAEDAPHVFISEINWAGSQISTADEWIELVNLGQTPVDVSHYVLTGAASSGGAIELAEGTIIGPGSTLLIANYALGDPKTSLLLSPNLVTTAISLPNSALDILLTTPAGLVIDNYTDAGTPDFGLTNPATSIERDLTTLAWRSSTQSLNLSAATQLGTPGIVSLPPVVNVSPAAPTVDEPIPAVSEPAVDDSPVVEPAPEPVVVEPQPEADLPQPCTPVVLENEAPSVSEPVPEPVPSAPEISASVEAETPSISLIPSTPNEVGTPENTASNTLSVQKIAPGELVFNELVSDPTDGVEWVEILNTTSRSIDLTDSSMIDAGDHTTPLPDEFLAAGAMLVIENPNGNLNNSSETLTLFDSYGSVIDTLSYGTAEIPAPEDGESLARTSDGTWFITTATRNATNVFPAPVADTETYDPLSTDTYATTTNESDSLVLDPGTAPGSVEAADDTGSSAAEPVYRIVAIAKSVTDSVTEAAATSKTKNASSEVVVTGAVVALPDTFAKQTMFIDGHEIYFNAADWPELSLGDIVQITGTESTSNGAPRIKISSADAIVITGHTDLTPIPVDGSELATTPHGLLISMAGQVTGKSGSELSITTDDGTVITALAMKKTGVTWSSLASGSIIITGIAKHTEDGVVIAPRSMNDIHFTPNATLTSTLSPKAKTNTTPLVGGGLLTGSLGALGTWYVRSRKLLPGLPF